MKMNTVSSPMLALAALALCACGSCIRAREPDVEPGAPAGAAERARQLPASKDDVFRARAAEAADPVAFALPVVNSPDLRATTAAMDVLAEHWEDPRSERALAEIARGEPKYLGDGFKTRAGEAYERLLLLRGRKQYASLMAGKESPDQKMKAIRDAFAEHPDWLDPKTRPRERAVLVSLLVNTTIEVGGAGALDLVAQAGHMTPEYARRHPRETLEYAREIGCREACSLPRFLDSLAATQEEDAAALAREWLGRSRAKDEIFYLVDVLSRLPGGGRELASLLSAENPQVVYQAAFRLAKSAPTRATLEAISGTIGRLEEAGHMEGDLHGLEAVRARLQRSLEGAAPEEGTP